MDADALNAAGRHLWNEKAAFWDALHGSEGNAFHQTLVSPAVERLLAVQPGESVLDIGCGSGVLARRLAALGAVVTAVDFSEALIDLARQRGQAAGPPIQYAVVDATDEAALRAQGVGRFAALVSTMALMDMPVIAPVFRAARQLMQPGGRFVVALSHPAFNASTTVMLVERGERDGVPYTQSGIKMTAYLSLPPTTGAGAPGEPNPHYYYHRPLHELLGAAFAAGLVLDGLEEPAFPPPAAPSGQVGWSTLWQIPPVLVLRLRPGPAGG